MEVFEVTDPAGRAVAWYGRSQPRRSSVDLGTPPEAKPGELYIQVYEPDRDDYGRVRFFQFWHDASLPVLGPAGGLAIAQGKYTIWFKLVDTPEVPVIQVGTLYIT